MNRRGFLRMMGLAPVAAVVGVSAARAVEWTEPKAGYLPRDFVIQPGDYVPFPATREIGPALFRREYVFASSSPDCPGFWGS